MEILFAAAFKNCFTKINKKKNKCKEKERNSNSN